MSGGCDFVNITDPKTKIYNIERGVNELVWNVTKNGFTSRDTVVINNYSFTVNAGNDQHLCENETSINGSGPLNTMWNQDWTGQWIIRTGGVGSWNPNQNVPNPEISGLSADTSRLEWIVTRNNYPGLGVCKASDIVNIIYHKIPETDFESLPVVTYCSPVTLNFLNTTSPVDTVAGTIYNWNFGNMGQANHSWSDTASYTFTNVSNDSIAIYDVTVIARAMFVNGLTCTDTVSKEVTIWPVPTADFFPYPVIGEYLSTNNVENASTTNCNTYTLDWGDGVSRVYHSFIANYDHQYEYWGSYTITHTVVNTFGCSNTVRKPITLLEPVPASGGDNDVESCSPLNIQLYARVTNDSYHGQERFNYEWIIIKKDNVGDTLDVLYTKNPIFTFVDAGTYLAKLSVQVKNDTVVNPYKFIRNDTLVVWPVPVASFTVDPMQVMAPVQPIHCYNNSQNADESYWNFGLDDNSAVSTEKNPMYYYTEEGNYYISLEVKTKFGCRDRMVMEIPVTVLGQGNIVLPTAFIPESELESNQVFKPIVKRNVVEFNMLIFNRWGEIVFETEDVNQGWNGKVNDVLYPQDVYVYKVIVKYENGMEEQFVGSVTLLR
jgi:gliding motility-associated-like protein